MMYRPRRCPPQELEEQKWCRHCVSLCLVEWPARLPALLHAHGPGQQASIPGAQVCAVQNGLRCTHCTGGTRSCCSPGNSRQALCWRVALCSARSLVGCAVHKICLLCQVADPVALAITPGGLRSCCSTAHSQQDLLQVLRCAIIVVQC